MKNQKSEGLSIILPAFNEKGVIAKVISDVHACTSSLICDVEIIVVNDGSTDGTSEILDQISLSLPELKVISHQQNTGYGRALIDGIKSASKTWILLMDSDDQVRIDSLEAVWLLRYEFDVFLGYRRKRADGFYRWVMGRVGNTISNILLKYPVQDINCAFKLFKRDLLSPLLLSSSGGAINVEILYHVFRSHPSLKLYQFPIEHFPRCSGKSTGGSLKVIYGIIIEGIKILFEKSRL